MLRYLIKSAYFNGLSLLGASQVRIKALKAGDQCAVLNLHSVSPKANAFWPPLRPEIFEALLVFLKRNFRVCKFDELQSMGDGKPPAVLSFDDGYYDFIEYVMPLLEKYRMPANMNVIPECVNTGKPIWNVRLYDFLNKASTKLVNDIRIPGFNEKLTRDTPAAKLAFGLKISRYLKTRSRSERQEIWSSIEPYLEQYKTIETRMMNVHDVRQISGAVEIGVHSFSHESMGFESNEFFESDFALCQRYFDETLELPLSTYAFPNGSFRPEQVEFLRSHGIKNILLVNEEFSKRADDVFTRHTVYGESEAEVRMKALGF